MSMFAISSLLLCALILGVVLGWMLKTRQRKADPAQQRCIEYVQSLAKMLADVQRDFNHALVQKERLRFAVEDGLADGNWNNVHVALAAIKQSPGRARMWEWSYRDHETMIEALRHKA